ncbi:hypothetical protein BRC2024_ULFKEANI_CDS_0062 [Acinetobacter phage vB_AbaM_Konradin-v2]
MSLWSINSLNVPNSKIYLLSGRMLESIKGHSTQDNL